VLLSGEGLLAHRGPVVGGRLTQGLADLPELVDYLREQVQIAQSKWGATINADCNDSIGAGDCPTP